MRLLIFSIFAYAVLTQQIAQTLYPSDEKPTSCAVNPAITDLDSEIGVASVCQRIQNLVNPLTVEGEIDPMDGIRNVNNDKIPLVVPGCTYLEDRKECVPDDSTVRCAKFTKQGCTHCWSAEKARFKIPGYLQLQLEGYWSVQKLEHTESMRNFCLEEFKS